MRRTEAEQTYGVWADDVETAARQITRYANKMRKHRHDPERLQMLVDASAAMHRAAFAIREMLKNR